MNLPTVRLIFGVAGVYDFVIGLVFLCLGPKLFEAASVPPPNHWGYIQFASLMLLIFGVMFLAITVNPQANRNLMPFGMLLKASYVSVVFYYWLTSDVPMLFKPFAVIDAVMLVLFVSAYRALAPRGA